MKGRSGQGLQVFAAALLLRHDLQGLQERNQRLLIIYGACLESVTRSAAFTAVQQNGFGDGADVAAVTVRCGVADIPKFAGQEVFGAGFAVLVRASLGELLVSER